MAMLFLNWSGWLFLAFFILLIADEAMSLSGSPNEIISWIMIALSVFMIINIGGRVMCSKFSTNPYMMAACRVFPYTPAWRLTTDILA